jgi:ADP-heptose:LPS heptosyltransferase
VIRYADQPLLESPRIAVIANDAIGNFVMATPLLQLLREQRQPGFLAYFGGSRTAELQAESDLIDEAFELHGCSPEEFLSLVRAHGGAFDLVINLENTALSKVFAGMIASAETLVAGPCMNEGGRGDLPFADDSRGRLWADREWVSEDLTVRYPFLESGFIAEIFCRLCYLKGTVPAYRVPKRLPERPIPDVLVSASATSPDKLWRPEGWCDVLGKLAGTGASIGLVGAPPDQQARFWRGADVEERLVSEGLVRDLRGTMALPEVVGALSLAKAILTIDNGILHLAVAAGTPTVGLFRHGIHRLWAPPSPLLHALVPVAGEAVASISADEVWEALQSAIG